MGSEALDLEWVRGCPIPDLLTELALREPEAADCALWWRYRWDLEAFCTLVLPEAFRKPFSRMHRDLFAIPKTPWVERTRKQLEAIAAPRGGAKSTIVSWADLAHDVAYGLEAFVGIISTSRDLSHQLVDDLYRLFSFPELAPELHRLYGPFAVDGTKTDFVVNCPSSGNPVGCRIKAFSMRTSVRGVKHASWRVTKWVLDDIEHPVRVLNPDNRDQDEQFLESDVIKAGDDYTRVRLVGTVLCGDSVLDRKLGADAHRWDGRRYKSVLSFPDEMEGLWSKAQAIYQDIDGGGPEQREAAAREFYDANREAMDAGAEVLWPDGQPLFGLMLEYWDNPRSFYAELQNEPEQAEGQTFNVDNFQWVGFDGETITTEQGRKIDINACRLVVWWDPIPYGPKKTGRDHAAFAVVARCPNGGLYVLECQLMAPRSSPSRQWGYFFALMERYPRANFWYENNQGTLGDNKEFAAQLAKVSAKYPRIRLRGEQTRGRKEARIANSQPACESGRIRFNRDGLHPKVLKQYGFFPLHPHDDGPDAIERACHKAGKVGGGGFRRTLPQRGQK